jgi:hypothetical protein
MDQVEFDETIETLTEWVEACRQNKLFTRDDMAEVFDAILRLQGYGEEFNALSLLPETIHRQAFNDALSLLKTIEEIHRSKKQG